MIYMQHLREDIDFYLPFTNGIGVIPACLVCEAHIGDLTNRIIHNMLRSGIS